MKHDSKIFDDLARMAGGAVNLFSGLQLQIREEIRARVDEMLARMDVVPREDFERLEAMVTKLRLRQEELEKQLNLTPTKPSAPKKTTAKTSQTAKAAPAKKSPATKATTKTTAKSAKKSAPKKKK